MPGGAVPAAVGQGLVCPTCGHGRCAELKGRAVYQCNRCKRQVGLTAGTVFHWTDGKNFWRRLHETARKDC